MEPSLKIHGPNFEQELSCGEEVRNHTPPSAQAVLGSFTSLSTEFIHKLGTSPAVTF